MGTISKEAVEILGALVRLFIVAQRIPCRSWHLPVPPSSPLLHALCASPPRLHPSLQVPSLGDISWPASSLAPKEVSS